MKRLRFRPVCVHAVTVAAMAAAGLLTTGCSDDDVQFFDGHYSMKADTTVYASVGSPQEAVTLHHTDRLEDYSLSARPTQLVGKWRWVGIGSGSSFKPVYSWRGSSYHAITFNLAGTYKVRNGFNSIDGTYTARAGKSSLSIEPGDGTMVGTFSVTQNMHDEFFRNALFDARAYDIDSEGLLRIYYTQADYLVLVAADAVPEEETHSPELEELFGEWQMVGVAYGNGLFEASTPEGSVVFSNDYTATAAGGCRLLTSSLAREPLYYMYEYGSLSIGDGLYHIVAEGDMLYLCGGLDLMSPTLVLRRAGGGGQGETASARIRRDGYRIELYLTNPEGQRTDVFRYGENVVFNIDVINERDTALQLNNLFDLFFDRKWEMIYGTPLERGQLRSHNMSGPGIDTSVPTTVNPHSIRHWQSTLYATKTIDTTPPFGMAATSKPFPAGDYYYETSVMPEGLIALKLRRSFSILPKEQ